MYAIENEKYFFKRTGVLAGFCLLVFMCFLLLFFHKFDFIQLFNKLIFVFSYICSNISSNPLLIILPVIIMSPFFMIGYSTTISIDRFGNYCYRASIFGFSFDTKKFNIEAIYDVYIRSGTLVTNNVSRRTSHDVMLKSSVSDKPLTLGYFNSKANAELCLSELTGLLQNIPISDMLG